MQAPNAEQDGTGDQGAVTFTKAEQDMIAGDPELAQWAASRTEDYIFNFVPRPDDPANFDEQHSFVYNRDTVSFAIGGNAAGTTETSAFKCAEFLLRQQPVQVMGDCLLTGILLQVGADFFFDDFIRQLSCRFAVQDFDDVYAVAAHYRFFD